MPGHPRPAHEIQPNQILQNNADEDDYSVETTDRLIAYKHFMDKYRRPLAGSVAFFVLTLGLAAAAILVQQPQDIRQQAKETTPEPPVSESCVPQLISPLNGARISASTSHFEWEPCEGADDYQVQVQTIFPAIFLAPECPDCPDTSWTAPPNTFKPYLSYTWTVQACFDPECTITSSWAPPRTIIFQP